MSVDDVRNVFERVDSEPSSQFSVALLARLQAEYLHAHLDTSRDADRATLEEEVSVIGLVDEQPQVAPESRGLEQPSGHPRRRRIAFAAAAAIVLIIGAAVIVRTVSDDGARVKVPAGPGPVATTTPHPSRPFLPSGPIGLPPGETVSSVTAGGPGLVAGGSEVTQGGEVDAAIWTSADGTTWARVPDEQGVFGGPGVQEIADVTVGGPGLVAVGRGASVVGSDTYATAAVWTSAAGFNWSRVPHDDAVFWGATGQRDQILRMSAVTAGGPGLVAVGASGGASDYNEITGGWIERGVGVVWTSVDGITWSRVPYDPSVFGQWDDQSGGMSASMVDVTAGGPGFVAVGDVYRGGRLGYGAVWTSVDGVNWTLAEDRIEGANISGVTVGGPGLVAVGAAMETPPVSPDLASIMMAAVWTSADGTTWSRVPSQPEVLGGPGNQEMYAVHPGGPGLVAIGHADDGSAAAAWTSADGITWSRIAPDSVLGAGSKLDVLLRVHALGQL